MKNKKLVIIISILLFIAVTIAALFYFKIITFKEEEPEVNTLETIKDFNYELEQRDTELFKTEYHKLKDVLSREDIDKGEYAEEIAKLYIIDLYTISNKKNVYDVGSLEYVYPEIKDNFELKVKDTLYKYLENDTGKRTQKLPEVTAIQIDETKEDSIIYDNNTLLSYDILLSWSYKEDLGYDTSAELILVEKDNKIYVLEQK